MYELQYMNSVILVILNEPHAFIFALKTGIAQYNYEH